VVLDEYSRPTDFMQLAEGIVSLSFSFSLSLFFLFFSFSFLFSLSFLFLSRSLPFSHILHSFAGSGYMFRPDVVSHTVSDIKKGTRLMWSVGGLFKYLSFIYFLSFTYPLLTSLSHLPFSSFSLLFSFPFSFPLFPALFPLFSLLFSLPFPSPSLSFSFSPPSLLPSPLHFPSSVC
jgi:hypothetical protein